MEGDRPGPQCSRCSHRGLFYVLGIFEDYVLLGCPSCDQDFGVPVGQDID